MNFDIYLVVCLYNRVFAGTMKPKFSLFAPQCGLNETYRVAWRSFLLPHIEIQHKMHKVCAKIQFYTREIQHALIQKRILGDILWRLWFGLVFTYLHSLLKYIYVAENCKNSPRGVCGFIMVSVIRSGYWPSIVIAYANIHFLRDTCVRQPVQT